MSDCTIFSGFKRKDGYGTISRTRNGKKRIFMVHRWVWAVVHDKDPWNLPRWVIIKQTCGNHACINPEHLDSNIDDSTHDMLLRLEPVDTSGVVIPDKNKGLILHEDQLSTGALAHRKKKLCALGHAFRDASPDTQCTSCIAQRKLSEFYEPTPV